MTIFTLVFYIAIVAAIMTGILYAAAKSSVRNLFMSFFQNFCGALFIFSGFVKAVDPLGTAYKMEQYFAQFETTFEGTAMSFLAPVFPFFSSFSVGFSVFMIVFEIVLGVMLLIGSYRKVTAWAFLLLVVFFTFLTGFTYLTGFVPTDANFFNFSKWTAFNETNMRVTDCGCFGDFIKLKPQISFFKDVFLLLPSLFFVLKSSLMHELFNAKVRNLTLAASTLLLLLFCFQNFYWNLPIVDFRPFKEGTDVRTSKATQTEAVANAPIIFIYKNKETGEVKEFDMNSLPPEPWEYQDRRQEKVETNKIFDFSVEGTVVQKTTYLTYDDGNGNPIELTPEDTLNGAVEIGWTLKDSHTEEQTVKTDIAEKLLANPNYHFMIVCHDWKLIHKNAMATKINDLHQAAKAKGVEFYAVVGKAGEEDLKKIKEAYGIQFPIHTADDILLKTIVRSNPGVVLWKDGKVVKKWHHRQLPSFEAIERQYLK